MDHDENAVSSEREPDMPRDWDLLHLKGEGAALSFLGPGVLKILDSLPFYVLLVDRNHRIILANKATREDLKLDPKEIIGEYCPKIVHGIEEGDYPGCPLEEAVRTGLPVEKEHFDDEHNRWLKIAMYPTGTWTTDGEEIYFHMIQDITEMKARIMELEAELEQGGKP